MANYDKLRAFKMAIINPATITSDYMFGAGGGFFRSMDTGDVEIIMLDDNKIVLSAMTVGLLMNWIAIKGISSAAASTSTSIEVYHLST